MLKNIKNYFSSNKKGFTLIELLIVIAVLGVLAAVLLVAIDPLEQLNRARDSGVKSGVAQLGRALQAYATGQTTDGSFPTIGTVMGGTAMTNANWQTSLKNAGEIKAAVANSYTSNLCAAASGATSVESGFCYTFTSTADVIVWAVLQSKSEKSRANCTNAQVPVAIWSSTQGKAGTGCTTGNSAGQPFTISNGAAPGSGQTLY